MNATLRLTIIMDEPLDVSEVCLVEHPMNMSDGDTDHHMDNKDLNK